MIKIDSSRLEELYCSSLNLKNLEVQFKTLKDKYSVNFSFELQSKVLAQANRINSNASARFQSSKVDKPCRMKQSFQNGQLKIFLWVIAIYCQLKGLRLEKLTQSNFIEIQGFFPGRSVFFVKYKIDDILHGAKDMKKKTKRWTKEEDQLLEICVKSLSSGKSDPKWSEVSYRLYTQSQGTLFKTFQDCKERWDNHLNPSIKKSMWTDEEDYQLLLEAVNSNFIWAQVQAELKGTRTQHMVKNRFNSLYKFYCKQFNETNKKKLMKRVLNLLEVRIRQKSSEKEELIEKQKKTRVKLSEEKSQNQILQEIILRGSMEDFNRCQQMIFFQQYENHREGEDKFLTELYKREDKMEDQQKEVVDNRSTYSGQNALLEKEVPEKMFSCLHKKSEMPVYYPHFMEMDESSYLNHLNRELEARNCDIFLNDGENFEYP